MRAVCQDAILLLRLDGVHVVLPLRAGGPPGEAGPDVAVALHGREGLFDDGRGFRAGRRAEFAQKSVEMVLAAPKSEFMQTVDPDPPPG